MVADNTIVNVVVNLGFSEDARKKALVEQGIAISTCAQSLTLDLQSLSCEARKALALAQVRDSSGKQTLSFCLAFLDIKYRKIGYEVYHADIFPTNVAEWETVLLAFATLCSVQDALIPVWEEDIRLENEANQASNESRRQREAAEGKAMKEQKQARHDATLLTYAEDFLSNDKMRAETITDKSATLSYKKAARGFYDADLAFDSNSPVYAEAVRRRDADLLAKVEAERVEKAAAAKVAAERREWILAHGSDYLKKTHAAGYNCQRVYVTERAALEYPDYALDFRNEADWKARACPSEVMLEEALRVNGRVVWMTAPGATLRKAWNLECRKENYKETDPFSQCEVVVVRFLGQYDLVKKSDTAPVLA